MQRLYKTFALAMLMLVATVGTAFAGLPEPLQQLSQGCRKATAS